MIGNYRTSLRGAPLLHPRPEILEERRKFEEADLKRRLRNRRIDLIVLFDEVHRFDKETGNV